MFGRTVVVYHQVQGDVPGKFRVEPTQEFQKLLCKKKDEDSDDTESGTQHHSPFVLCLSVVFNAAQVQGWTAPSVMHGNGAGSLELVDTFVKLVGADIQYGAGSAYYVPRLDRIYMPDKTAFIDTTSGNANEGFYSVLLHEHIHWTGHDSRLKRSLIGHYGSHAYAMEELIAELGAAYLCATLGISSHPRDDHASYIAGWLTVLRQLKSAIFVAASSASIASQYLGDVYIKNNAVQDSTS